jgi:hypothetical protein
MKIGTAMLALLAALVLAGLAWADSDEVEGGESSQIVFASNRADGIRELYAVNGDGSGERRLTFNDIVERQPVWSPRGDRIAFAGLKDGNFDIYTVDARGGDLRRLTSDPARDDYPRWNADGQITFQRGPFNCPCEAWIVEADGSGERKLDTGHGNALTPEPAPHGHRLAFASDRDGEWAIYTMQIGGDQITKVSDPASAAVDFHPRWSPRANWIAFLRDPNGIDNDLYVVRANGSDLRRLTDTPDRVEFWPSWSPDGRELLFTTGAASQRLRTISLADGAEHAVSTWPQAPLADGFDDDVRDASLWHQIVDPGATLAESGGRLEVAIDAGAVPGGPWNQVDAHYGSNCSLPGDYDYQVDYELREWPAAGGVFAALNTFFAQTFVSRRSSVWGNDYTAWVAPSFETLPTSDTSGSMRLVRSAGVTAAYVRSPGGSWQQVLSGAQAPAAAVYGMGLTAMGSEFTGEAAAVAYDNFALNAGELVCPDWWSDSMGDFSRREVDSSD